MAAPIRFLSGRQQQQKIGIEGSTEDKKVLEVVGRTGIGTTSFEPAKILDVRGDAIVEGTTTVGKLEITGTGDVPASLTVETANVTGVSTFGGAVDVNAGLDVDGQADLDEVVVAGVATFSNAVDINSTLDVDGDTQLDDLTVAGVATFSSAINATDIIKGYEYTAAPFGSTVTLAVTVASKDSTHRYNGTGSSNAYVIDGIQSPFLTLTPGRTYRFTNDNTGSHPFRFYLEADKTTQYDTNVNFQDTYTEITITDETPTVLHYQCSSHPFMGNAIQTNANVVNTNYPATIRSTLDVTGVSTFPQLDVSTGGLDVDGLTNLDELIVAGVSTFTGNIIAATAEFSGNVTIGGTLTVEDKTNVDSIGLITARTGVRVTAGGIDVTAGVSTFNGSVDINNSVGVVGGLTADSLTISGVTTGINAAGISSFVRIDVDGQADLDEVVVAGAATFSGSVNFDVNSEVNIGTGVTILGNNLHVTGIVSATQFIGDGSGITNLPGISTLGSSNLTDVNVSGTTTTTQLRVSGIGTAEKLFVSTGGLEVDGQTDLDELVVAGVSTFNANTNVVGDLSVTGDIGASGIITATGINLVAGSGLDVGAIGVLTALSVDVNTGGIDVDGQATLDEVVVAGVSTFSALVDVNNRLDVVGGANIDQVNVTGIASFAQLDVSTGGIDVDGQATLDEVVVAGVSTFTGTVNIDGALDIGVAGVDVEGLTNLDELIVAGVSTFQSNVNLGQNDKLLFNGTTGLEIYENGSVGIIQANNSAGRLQFEVNGGSGASGELIQFRGTGNLKSANFRPDSNQEFFSKIASNTSALRLETRPTGVAVVGIATASGISVVAGSGLDAGATGVVTAVAFHGDGSALTGIAATDHVSTFDLVVAGISTFNNEVSINHAASAFSPHLELFAENSYGGLLIAKHASSYPDLEFRSEAGGGSVALFKGVPSETVGSQSMSGIRLVDYKAIIFGTGNDSYMRYDPTPGVLDISTVVSEPITFNTNETERLRIAADGLVSVSGIVSATGINVFAGAGLTAGNTGVITAVAFHGDGSALTGIAATDHVSTFDLVVAGISTFNNDVNFVGDSANIFFDKSQDRLEFADTAAAIFGTNDDLQIYHNSHSYIDHTGANNLHIRNTVDDQDITIQTDDGSGGTATYFQAEGASGRASMHFYGARKLYTNTGGVDVTGGVNATGVITATSFVGSGSGLTGIVGGQWQKTDVGINTVDKVGIGTTSPQAFLEIHVGTAVTAVDVRGSEGQLFSVTNNLTSGSIFSVNDVSGIPSIDVDADGTIQIAPYGAGELVGIGTTNPTSKLDIVGDVQVVGVVTATSFSGDGSSLTGIGGTDHVSTFDLVVAGISTLNDNVVVGNGLTVTGISTFNSNVKFPNDAKALFGSVSGLEIYHANSGNDSYIQKGTEGNLRIQADQLFLKTRTGSEYMMIANGNQQVELYYDGIKKFETTASGISVTGGVEATGVSTFSGIATHIDTLHGQTLKIAGVSTFSDAVKITKANNALDVNVLTTNDAIRIQNNGSTVGALAPTYGNRFKVAGRNKHLMLSVNDNGGETYEIHMNSSSRRILTATHNDGVAVSGIVTATAMNVVAGSGLDAGNTGVVTAVAFHGDGSNLTNIPGTTSEVDTNVSSTSAVGVGSFATASFRSAEVIAQIVQIDEYQVGKYLMIHDGTTVTVIEQAAVATGDSMLGSFDGAINGSNAELRVNMVSSGIATVTTKISTVTI